MIDGNEEDIAYEQGQEPSHAHGREDDSDTKQGKVATSTPNVVDAVWAVVAPGFGGVSVIVDVEVEVGIFCCGDGRRHLCVCVWFGKRARGWKLESYAGQKAKQKENKGWGWGIMHAELSIMPDPQAGA